MKGKMQKGFTLIEVIVTFVLMSILAVMTVSFSDQNIFGALPGGVFTRAANLQTGIDNVTRAYYNLTPPVSHAVLVTFQGNIANYISVNGITVDSNRTLFVTFLSPDYVESADTSANAPNLKVTLVNTDGQSISTIYTTY